MKKTYVTPQVVLMEFQTEGLLCGSVNSDYLYNDNIIFDGYMNDDEFLN